MKKTPSVQKYKMHLIYDPKNIVQYPQYG